MPAINFDTLAYAKEMEAAGFTREQADAFATAQGKILKDAFAATELATRSDVRDVRDELKGDIQDVRTEIQDVRNELKTEIQNVRTEIRDVRDELKTEIQDVRNEIQDVRNELKTEIQDVRNEVLRLENRMEANKHEVLKWVIGTMVAQTALIVAVIAFLK